MSDAPDQPQRDLSPIGLYSHAAEVADRLPQMVGTPQQFAAMLQKQGVKPDELKWSDYDKTFAGQKKITKQQLAAHFKAKMPKVMETTLTDQHPADYAGRRDRPLGAAPRTKYSQYTLPGGQNYREVLLHLPPEQKAIPQFKVMRSDGIVDSTYANEEGARRRAEQIAFGRVVPAEPANVEGGYKSSHWDQPNVLAHLRLSDRKGPKGEKILHLEEMQSDWAQEGRKKGFRTGNELGPEDDAELTRLFNMRPQDRTPEQAARFAALQARGREVGTKQGRLPAAPYVDSTAKWMDLGLKRVLHEAAKGGYDKVVVTPGQEQADRYDLSKHINQLTLRDNSSGGVGRPSMDGPFETGHLTAHDHHGKEVISKYIYSPEELTDHVGKEAAEKLLQAQPRASTSAGVGFRERQLAGQDLRIGGAGMKSFYDKLLPQALEKLAKRHNPQARMQLYGDAARPNHDPRLVAIEILNDRGIPQPEHNAAWNAIPSAERRRLVKEHEERVKLHSLDITPEMRASILRGHAAYADGGSVATAKPTFAELNALAAEHGANSPQFTRAYEAYNQEPEPEKLQKAAGGSVNHDPTEAQKAAGNYAKERISFQGLPISIENKAGSTRRGVDDKGRRWSSRVPCDYGYIRGTEGADGDHVDCYIGREFDSNLVVVVNQHDYRNDRFDEHKCLLGFKSERDALKCYCDGFSDGKGPDRIGSVATMSMDAFKHWLKHGRTTKRAHGPSIVDKALGLVRGSL